MSAFTRDSAHFSLHDFPRLTWRSSMQVLRRWCVDLSACGAWLCYFPLQWFSLVRKEIIFWWSYINQPRSPPRASQLLLLSSSQYEWSVSRRGDPFRFFFLSFSVFFFSLLLPILFLGFEKGGRKLLWNLSKRCGLGWACMGASVPKNGNNRPLSRCCWKTFPQVSFLLCAASSFLDYVTGKQLPVLKQIKGRYAGLSSDSDIRGHFFLRKSQWRWSWPETSSAIPYQALLICVEILSCDDLHISVCLHDPHWSNHPVEQGNV